MRTTIRIDDELLKDVKKAATDSGRTLTEFVEEALREVLARRQAPRPRKRVTLPVFKGGGGVMPGVDINNSAALLDIMEGIGASPRR